jgi:hypothetical protein
MTTIAERVAVAAKAKLCIFIGQTLILSINSLQNFYLKVCVMSYLGVWKYEGEFKADFS